MGVMTPVLADLCPLPQIHIKPSSLIPQDVTVFGDRDFQKGINVLVCALGWEEEFLAWHGEEKDEFMEIRDAASAA